MITVGWCPYKRTAKYLDKYELEFVHNVYFEPEMLSDLYKDNTALFSQCPAHTHFLKSFWVVKSPVDLTLICVGVNTVKQIKHYVHYTFNICL